MQKRHILAYGLFFLILVLFRLQPKTIWQQKYTSHTGKHACYAEDLRHSVRQFTPTSGKFRVAFWGVQLLAWRKAETF